MDRKISVILPVFNGEKRIKTAIESVTSQTYENIQIIIVNDCSQDGTQKIIEKCAKEDNRIEIINNECNQKLPKSLNIGFRSASGDYLTWTSDDNTYHQNALEMMADFLDNSEGTDLVYTDFSKFDMNGKIQKMRLNGPDDIRFVNTVGACFLYRKTLAEKIGEYDPDMFLAEDYEYWIRAYLFGKICHLPVDLYNYSIHDKSLTYTRAKEIRKQTFNAKNKHFNDLLNRCYSQKDRNRFFHEMLVLLDNADDIKKFRDMYYKKDKSFARIDKIMEIGKHAFHFSVAQMKRIVDQNSQKSIK